MAHYARGCEVYPVEYLADDELLEVTPGAYRIRKRILNTDERGKQTKKVKEQFAEA